jgi:hypothetical protein
MEGERGVVVVIVCMVVGFTTTYMQSVPITANDASSKLAKLEIVVKFKEEKKNNEKSYELWQK